MSTRYASWHSGPTPTAMYSCGTAGKVTYSLTDDERLYVTLDVSFSDQSRAAQSFWLSTDLCGRRAPASERGCAPRVPTI